MTWRTIECSKWFRIFLTIGLVAGLILAADRLLERVVTDKRPPIASWGDVEALEQPTILGEKTTVRVQRKKVRTCPLDARRTAVRVADGLLFDVPDSFWAGGPTGEIVDLTYDTSNLMPGKYLLRVRLTYHCEDSAYVMQQPDIPFEIAISR